MNTTDTDWRQRAACLNVDPDNLYPVGRQGAGEAEHVERQAAQDICIGMRCPVIDQCLTDALSYGIGNQHGVSGAKTAAERTAILRKRQREATAKKDKAAKAVCGTLSGYSAHRRDNTPKCRPCLDAANDYARKVRGLEPKVSA